MNDLATSLWVKICGITREADAWAAVEAGADAIGLNLWPQSPRCVDWRTAARIAAAVHGQIAVVTVLVDMTQAEVEAVKKAIQPDLVQLHGAHSRACLPALLPFAYQAVSLALPGDVDAALSAPGPWVLVDAHDSALRGGTGMAPPVVLARAVCQARPTVLAGGLGPDNVGAAVQALRPRGVDAASRLEVSPGRKDVAKIRAFVQAARQAEPLGQTAPGRQGVNDV